MRKFLVLTGAVLLLTALGLGGWWAWPILFPSLPQGWLSTLAKADAALVQNRPDLAKAVLAKAPVALPVSGWLQWEKRVQAVVRTTKDWPWASQVAQAAQSQYPGNSDLTAYLVWTLLQQGKAVEASAIAQKVLPGTPWASLATQASVEAAGLASGDWSGLRQTLSEPSGEAFGVYDRLAAISPEPELQKNALLSALSRGDLEGARGYLGVLTPRQRDQAPFDRLQALMAYDQGDWTRAAALLRGLPQNRSENLLVLADVYLHLGDPSQARVIYDQMLADQPDEIPASLAVNRATLALDDGASAEALGLLERFSTVHPEAGTLQARLLSLEARFRLGDHDDVRKALDGMLGPGEETDLALEAGLLKDRLYPDLASVPQLWSLLHRHPGFQPLAERLAWMLLSTQDYQGAIRVLDLHEKALESQGLPRPWWSSFLRALVLGAQNRLPEADTAFGEVPAAWRSAAFYADWALVAAVRSQQTDPEGRKAPLSAALERLTQALELLPPASDPGALRRRSLWLTRRGELHSALVPLELPAQRGTLRSAAAEDFRQAVHLDPDNLRASFLLRQAEATPQDKL